MKKRYFRGICLIIGLLYFAAVFTYAATITVINTNDDGPGSLRQAIADALSGDTIDFSVTGAITLTTGELVIDKFLTITGPGPASLTIDGNAGSRILTIDSGFGLVLSGITITNGYTNAHGGGINNRGNLVLVDSVVSNCDCRTGGAVDDGIGGGIYNYMGNLSIENCTISGNYAYRQGGGIRNTDGSISIYDSTIFGNSSDTGGGICDNSTSASYLHIERSTIYNNSSPVGVLPDGGGIYFSGGTLELFNSTITGNFAKMYGGGVYIASHVSVTIANCTITENAADFAGGGTAGGGPGVYIRNTILANNSCFSDNPDNHHPPGSGLVSQGYNLENGTECGFTAPGDIQNGVIDLEPIADNGGPTRTHALKITSDALDAIPEGGSGYNGALVEDQRNVSRPQCANADIGAFELEQVPRLTTQAATGIGTTTATGAGTITASGSTAPSAHGMAWNTTGSPTLSDSFSDEGGTSAIGSFTSDMTGLSPDTTYYYRAYATNTVGTGYGGVRTFSTKPDPPIVSTQPVTGIDATSATAHGTIEAPGVPNATAHGMVWNTTGNPTLGDNSSNEGPAAGTGPFTSNITGLTPNKTYFVRAYATNVAGTVYGDSVTFTTLFQYPAVTTLAVTGTGMTEAVGHGDITLFGIPAPSAHGMVWNTTGNPMLGDNSSNEGPAVGTGPFTSAMTGLTPYTTYFVKAYVSSTAYTAYGNQVFYTTKPQLPAVTTRAVSDIGLTSATGNGDITVLGAPGTTAHGMVWNTTGSPTLSDSFSDEGEANATGVFTSGINGLLPGTTYFVKSYATNRVGTVYGDEISFATYSSSPTVTTLAVSDISPTSAVGNGTIENPGVLAPTAHGVVWNHTGAPPTLADNFTDEGPVSGTGDFSSLMTGLTPNTTYYVRAYATNEAGTSYGNKVIFNTGGGLPSVITTKVTGITDTSATGGGKVTGEGGDAVTARGVCWSISSRPTTSDDHTDDGTGSGRFTSYLTGLTPGTTYYYRAYATNFLGTAYGREKSFTTEDRPASLIIEIIEPEDGANVGGVVTIKARVESEQGIANVEFFVDGEKIGDGTPVQANPGIPVFLPADVKNDNKLSEAAAPGKEVDPEFIDIRSMGKTYSIDWDATLYDPGLHTITAAAHDAAGQKAEDSISVNIPEVLLTLSAWRETERSWIVSKLFGKLEILAENSSDVPVSKYVIYRKVVDESLNTLNTNTEGEFTVIATFTDADLEDRLYNYDDKYLEQDKTYIYKVEAKDENDAVIAISQDVTI